MRGARSIPLMSRRSRKRSGDGKKPWLGKVVIAMVATVVLAIAGGYAAVRSYLHSDKFRKFLSAEASKVAAVSGEFSPFRWQGLAVDTDGFHAKGEGLVTEIRADGLHTEIGLGGIGRGVWEVRESGVRRLEVSLDARKRVDREAADAAEKKSESQASRSGWLPKDAELEGAKIGEVSVKAILEQGLVTADGMRVRVDQSRAKKGYLAEIAGGTVKVPFDFVPELRLDKIKGSYQDGRVFITDAGLDIWEKARIQGSGEYDLREGPYVFEGSATGISCENVFGETWAKRLTGDITSKFILTNGQGAFSASGDLVMENGVMTALPILDALAAYADTRRFRVLTLNEAHTDWRWSGGSLFLDKMVLASEGLVRLEGGMAIRGREIDGVFRLGLAPGTLSTIPGAETDVFLPGERGLLWAPLRITGTLDDPKEDLTDRLVAAAGARMFDKIPETGEKVIKFTQSVLGEPPTKAVETGVKVIEEGSRVVRDVGGILGGFLGSGDEEEKKNEDR